MKTLQVPFHFFPEAVGGTEVYALALAHRLRNAGHTVEFAAPGETRTSYTHEGFPVHRFAVTPVKDVAELYNEGDAGAAAQFDEIVSRVQPDVVHLHALSPAVSLCLVRMARERKIPVILTAHVPGVFCPRKTMMRYGATVCDGAVEPRKCSRCVLQSRGLPKALAQMIGSFPSGLGSALASTGGRAAWMTAFRMTQLIGMQRAVFTQILEETSHVVAVSEWVRQGLLKNGASASRLTLCRQGLTHDDPSAGSDRTRETGCSIAYLGRIDPVKGVHVLVEAIVRSPRLPVHLDIYGIVHDGGPYLEQLTAAAGQDRRIRFLQPVPNHQVVATMRGYDAIAVPSVWLETGPLVVYDAFAAGVPVIGSRRGGIAELVTHEQDGLLVEPGDPSAWAAALERICAEDGLLDRLRRGVQPPRTMDTVATEMLQLYRHLTS